VDSGSYKIRDSSRPMGSLLSKVFAPMTRVYFEMRLVFDQL